MRQTQRGYSVLTVLTVFVLGFAGGCGEGSAIRPVGEKIKGFVVELATETGTVVKENARTLAEAIEQAWRKFFPKWDKSKTIKITSADGLRGEFQGVFQLKVVLPRKDGVGGCAVEVTLRNPAMCRKTAADEFSLDPVNYPPSIRKELAASP